jgi:hypothetical protein
MSSDPLLHPFARDLVASSKKDAPPARGPEHMLAALGLAVVPPLDAANSAGDASGAEPGAGGVPAAVAPVGAVAVVPQALFIKAVVLAALGGALAGAASYHVAVDRGEPARAAPITAVATAPAALAPAPVAVPMATVAPAPEAPALPAATVRDPGPLTAAPKVGQVATQAASPAPVAPASATPPLEADRELAREMAQVAYTRSLVEKRSYAEALQAIGAYRASLGKVLEPEMRALEVEATVLAGHTAEGKALARAFLEDYPRHPAAPRVRGFLAP